MVLIGILRQVWKAKEESEIAGDKEQLQLAMTSLNMENETDLIKKKEKFIESLDNYNTDVYINGKGFTVHFKGNNRIYTIDENSKIKQEDLSILERDTSEGTFDGAGTEENPYVIMSIEDLLEWSRNYNTYKGKYIKLGKTLDFKSELSYCDYTNTNYNMFLVGENSDIPLFDILTNQIYPRI